MSVQREELHHLIDELPEEQVGRVLALVRGSVPGHASRKAVLATLAAVQERMSGVTGVDEELQSLRDELRD
ncbi:hypothetical protein OG320_15930 [Microbispora sp. NBC_01189]|uniref:hypothetical protein n=1 Tax=Microbispora sp. NBC_01189 TaxID=2903583 RepID=UPI002E0ED5C8|nr:hypothetical protein OG320_15930 [Microbispora sp. NBC_01189]